MAEHVWSVLCYKGCVDKFSNQVSLLDIFEVLTLEDLETTQDISPDLNTLAVKMNLVSFWTRSDASIPEEGTCKFSLVMPSGKVFKQPEYKLSLTTENNCRIILVFDRIPFEGIGHYSALVEQKKGRPGKERWLKVAKIPLEIKVAEKR